MKNRKWLTYTLGTLLTLVVLAAVAGVSFRIGMMQNKSLARPAFARGFIGAPQAMQRNFQNNGGAQEMQGNFQGNGWMQMRGNPRNQGFDNRSNNRFGNHHGGMFSFFPFLFGLIHLVVLGLILWVVYLLVKKSGWRLTRVEAVPVPVQTASVEEVGEKKTSN